METGPKVSVVVPAHNEKDNLGELVGELVPALQSSQFADAWEIVLVDDNSTDGTSELADELAGRHPGVRCVHRKGGAGFGRAIKDGLKAARGQFVIPFMGDLSDEPTDLIRLASAADQGYGVAYGSRFIPGGKALDYPSAKFIANRAYNRLVGLLFGLPHRDITNAFKCYRRDALDAIGIDGLESDGFEITVELPLKAHIAGFSSIEVPVTWHGRKRGESKLNLGKSAPAYGKRLLSLFIRGNLLAVRELLSETVRISKLRLLGSLLVGALMFVAMFFFLDFSEVSSALSRMSVGLWILACSAIFVSFLVRTWRWSVLLRSAGRVSSRDLVFSSLLFGWLVNYIVPARLGDLLRPVALSKSSRRVEASLALSTVVVERVMDVVMLAALLGLSSWWLGTAGWERLALLMAGAGALVLVMILVVSGTNLVRRLPGLRRLAGIVDSMRHGLNSMWGNKPALLLSFGLSFPVWGAEIACLYFSALALGLPVGVYPVVIAATSAFVVQTVPLTPGGIGIHEATIAAVLALFDIGGSDAMAAALIDHLARAAVIYLFGLISIFHLATASRRNLSAHRQGSLGG